jgi:hypothetical protein
MATGSYDTDAMRGLAAHLDAARSALSALAQGLNQAAQCYDDLDRSLVGRFGSAP